MSEKRPGMAHGRWAEFRFGVVANCSRHRPSAARARVVGAPVQLVIGGEGGVEWRFPGGVERADGRSS
jgi:hypothetical protein